MNNPTREEIEEAIKALEEYNSIEIMDKYLIDDDSISNKSFHMATHIVALKSLQSNGKKLSDVEWFGYNPSSSHAGIYINGQSFLKDLELPVLPVKLLEFIPIIMVGKDWWMELHISEESLEGWWEFKTMPVKPVTITTL